MTTQADRIEQREREGIAWAIRDMLLTASRDETPSTAAQALLAIMRDRAPAIVRRQIERAGLGVFAIVLPEAERIALFDALKDASERIADRIIYQIHAQQAGNGGRDVLGRFTLTDLLARALRLCTGLKSACEGRLSRGM